MGLGKDIVGSLLKGASTAGGMYSSDIAARNNADDERRKRLEKFADERRALAQLVKTSGSKHADSIISDLDAWPEDVPLHKDFLKTVIGKYDNEDAEHEEMFAEMQKQFEGQPLMGADNQTPLGNIGDQDFYNVLPKEDRRALGEMYQDIPTGQNHPLMAMLRNKAEIEANRKTLTAENEAKRKGYLQGVTQQAKEGVVGKGGDAPTRWESELSYLTDKYGEVDGRKRFFEGADKSPTLAQQKYAYYTGKYGKELGEQKFFEGGSSAADKKAEDDLAEQTRKNLIVEFNSIWQDYPEEVRVKSGVFNVASEADMDKILRSPKSREGITGKKYAMGLKWLDALDSDDPDAIRKFARLMEISNEYISVGSSDGFGPDGSFPTRDAYINAVKEGFFD